MLRPALQLLSILSFSFLLYSQVKFFLRGRRHRTGHGLHCLQTASPSRSPSRSPGRSLAGRSPGRSPAGRSPGVAAGPAGPGCVNYRIASSRWRPWRPPSLKARRLLFRGRGGRRSGEKGAASPAVDEGRAVKLDDRSIKREPVIPRGREHTREREGCTSGQAARVRSETEKGRTGRHIDTADERQRERYGEAGEQRGMMQAGRAPGPEGTKERKGGGAWRCEWVGRGGGIWMLRARAPLPRPHPAPPLAR